MSSAPQPPEHAQCPVCCAQNLSTNRACNACGSQLHDTTAQEIRNLNYLLAELSRWESNRIIQPEQASELRARYERRRAELRAQLTNDINPPEPSTNSPENAVKTPAPPTQQQTASRVVRQTEQLSSNARTLKREAAAGKGRTQKRFHPVRSRRALLETLADPHTIRLLLYTGAAMLVVGVVIWLRDVLYQKLQEPLVQAGLLITGTLIVTVSGWLTTLRTRLLLTGRALTLIGSLLVPINFWFLVRSGLIENHGRAWIVCAFCTALYAATAAILREKLYVYLASAAAVATIWTIIYRIEREAFGLYALSLMIASLIFLQLSRLRIADFGLRNEQKEGITEETSLALPNPQSAIRNPQSSGPLVHVALTGASLSALLYMLLRLGSSPSFADGILRLRANEYDPSIALLLFALGAYAAWFTGRVIYTDRRTLLYTITALALFALELITADGFRLSASLQLLTISMTAFIVALSAHALRENAVAALAVYRASLIVSVLVASFSCLTLLTLAPETFTESATFIFLALTSAALSAPRFSQRIAPAVFAYAAALFASVAFFVALRRLNLQSETLFYTACACLPFVLYLFAQLTRRTQREAQLSRPFILIADAEFVLLLLFVAVVAFVLNQAVGGKIAPAENLRGAAFSILFAAMIYGALRCWVEHSFVGAVFIPVAVCLATLIVFRVDGEWFATISMLMLFPTFFAMDRYARARKIEWLTEPANVAAGATIALVSTGSLTQASIHLSVGDAQLLAPCIMFAVVALLSFVASLWSEGLARIRYFRVGLIAVVVSFIIAFLRAGFDPIEDVELYTAPIAILLLTVSYLSVRRRNEDTSETGLLLWLGSLLLAAPMLTHALQYRLLLSLPALGRDLLTLCASLLLLFFGVTGRLRAPVLTGAVTLVLELLALALTSVDWMQIPLKVYLITVGALILLIWGLLEFRREQILLMRQRFNERREYAREKFGEWR